MICRFLFLFIILLCGNQGWTEVYNNHYYHWSMDIPSCYKLFTLSKEKPPRGTLEFLADKCGKNFYNLSVEPLDPIREIPFEENFSHAKKYRLGFSELPYPNSKGFLYAFDSASREDKKKKLQPLTWYARFYCNNKWVKLGFYEKVPSHLVSFRQRWIKLKGPSEESMKILKTFRCLKKEKIKKASKKKKEGGGNASPKKQ